MPMLQSIVDANPGMQNSDYLRLYNQHVTNDQVNSRISYDKYETTGSQKEDFTRLLPELLQGTREIQRINKKTGKIEEVSQAEAQALGEA